MLEQIRYRKQIGGPRWGSTALESFKKSGQNLAEEALLVEDLKYDFLAFRIISR